MAQNQSAAHTIAPFPPGVTLTTLDNGLTLIVREDHSAPVVSAQAQAKAVTMPEMDMNVAHPARPASRRLFETAYTKSPYRFTVIGYPDIFHELKPEDILAYYHEKYAPNNVFYVVAGDVKPDEVVAQLRGAYDKAKAKALPPMVLPEEPKQTAAREIVEEAPIELGHFHFAWHIPE